MFANSHEHSMYFRFLWWLLKFSSICSYHRHLRKIDLLMAHTARLVCLVSVVSGCIKKAKNALGRCGSSSLHITKLEQSRFSLDVFGFYLPWIMSVPWLMLRYLWDKVAFRQVRKGYQDMIRFRNDAMTFKIWVL